MTIWTLADVTLRASIPVIAALAALVCLRRRSAALRHAVLVAGLAAAAATVPLSIALPHWDVDVAAPPPAPRSDAVPATVAPAAGIAAPPAAGAAMPVASAAVSLDTVAATAWIAGAAAGMAWLVVGWIRLRGLTRRARPLRDDRWQLVCRELRARHRLGRPIQLLIAHRNAVVATWGVRRPRVLLPPSAGGWSDERMRLVLGHELAHIARHDWPIQMAADILRACCWWNPLFWIVSAHLRRESERACDDVVLAAGASAVDYAGHLVEIARAGRVRPRTWAVTMPVARPSTLEGRIAAMLNVTLDRRPPSPRGLLIAGTVLFALALAAATIRAAAPQGPLPLTGQVFDPSGALLPGVQLTLDGTPGNRWLGQTDAAGRFEFPPVDAGSYVLEAALPGFRALRQEVSLTEGRDWSRVIILQVATLQETITVRASRPTAPASDASPAPPLRVGGHIKAPLKLVDVRPVYPEAMRAAGLEGLVPVDALIGIDGTVTSARVVSAQVHPAFARSALDAVRQWRFSPTLLNGAPVDVVMAVSVRFSLAD